MNKNDYDILFLLKYLNKCLQQDLDDKLKQVDLTATQGRVVFFISYMESNGKQVTPNNLITRFSLSKSTVSELINRLVIKNLVKKNVDKNRVFLTTTDYSKDLIREFDKARNKTKEQLTKGLEENQTEEFKKYILKMIENIKGDDAICGNK